MRPNLKAPAFLTTGYPACHEAVEIWLASRLIRTAVPQVLDAALASIRSSKPG